MVFLLNFALFAQETSVTTQPKAPTNEKVEDAKKIPVEYSIFVDTYYLKANNKYPNNQRSYTTQALDVENLSLNFALVQFSYEKKDFRGNLGLHTGTYVDANYAAEPQLLKNVYEAVGGYQIVKNLWLDVGIFASHIGMENAISRDNINYTRSIMAENSPYYEAGAKLSYKINDKWTARLLLVNGWQVIKDNNRDKSWGTQLTYSPNDKLSFNWSTYIGNDAPDNEKRQTRYFNHLSATLKLIPKVEIMAAYDLGHQKKPGRTEYDRWQKNDFSLVRDTNDNGYYRWMTGAIQLRYHINQKIRIGTRLESFIDKNQVIVSTSTPNGYQNHGASVNLDFQPMENLLFRVEAKSLRSADNIFPDKNLLTRKDEFLVASMSFWF